MLSLIIDAGNTFIKVKTFCNNKIAANEQFSTELEAKKFILELKSEQKISACIVSAVRDLDPIFLNFINKNFKTILFNSEINLPIELEYKTPETLGKDRIAAICGASVLFPNNNLLIIDAGTAITYDLLKGGLIHAGGNISPGLQTRFKALNTFTGKLPLLDIKEKKQRLFGQTTEEAIRCGVQNGMIYEIDGCIDAFKSEYLDLKIIFTGGDCFFFEKLLKNRIFAEPNLTAIGLNKILELNV